MPRKKQKVLDLAASDELGLDEKPEEKPSRDWFLTLNHPTPQAIAEFEEFCSHGLVYACLCHEVGQKCGTPHMHVYFYMANTSVFSLVKRYFVHSQPNIQPARGTPTQSRQYLRGPHIYADETKTPKPLNKTFKEWGTLPVQGKRTDIDFARAAAYSGMSTKNFIRHATSYTSIKAFQLINTYEDPPFRTGMKVVWVYGPPEQGKSKFCFDSCLAKNDKRFFCPMDATHWEGYDGHQNVILEEFRSSFMPWADLLRLLDVYPMRVNCKFGSAPLVAKVIFINSVFSPLEVYSSIKEDRYQLYRRIFKCYHCFKEDGQYKREVVELPRE